VNQTSQDLMSERILDAAQDSVGRTFRIDRPGDIDVLTARARRRGLRVIEIEPLPDVHAFAFGALLQALEELSNEELSLPRVGSVSASTTLSEWLGGEIEDQLRALGAATPAVVVLRAGRGVDPGSRAWLEAMASDPRDITSTWIIEGDLTPERASVFFDPKELTPDMRLIAQVIAVLDAAPTVDEIVAVTGIASIDVDAAVAAMQALGIIARLGDHLALTDPSVTARLWSTVPGSLRTAIRREMVASMRERGVAAVAIAEMAQDSARPDDGLAVDVMTDAMSSLASRQIGAAADFGLAAAATLTRPSPKLTALAWALLPLLWQTGREGEAREVAARVFSEDGGVEAEARVLLWLARIEASSDRALELVETALSLNEAPPALRSELLTLRVRCLSGLGREVDVDEALPEALQLALRLEDHESLSRLHIAAGTNYWNRGAIAAALEEMRLALDRRERSGVNYAEWVPEAIAAPLWMAAAGDRAEALELSEVAKSALPPGEGPAASVILSASAQVLLMDGQLSEAYDEAVAAMTIVGAEPGSSPILIDRFHSISVSVRLKVALHRGDLHELRLIRRWFGDAPPVLNDEMSHRIRWWQLWLDDALVMNSPGTRLFSGHDLHTVPWADLGDEVRFVRALLMSGWSEPAAAILDGARARVDALPYHVLTATVLNHVRGLIEWDAELLREAADGWLSMERPLESAAAHSDLGIRLLELQDPEAVPILLAAHDQLIELGALHDAWRLRWALRARVPSLGIGALPDVSLTPMESRVVRAAVEGATVNQIAAEFGISPHTVDAHLRHVYTKHNLSSRSELLAWSRRN
jgi:DNA-binding CsgD family transcriptional regulator/tetratricopeptide (TPR) repeat protein